MNLSSFIYKSKFYKNPVIRKIISLSLRITYLFDGAKDKKICGCSLVKYVPSEYRKTMGATGSQSTCYWVLDSIFKDASIAENDRFIDVGCGKGRVIAYMLWKKYPCSLTGVELNDSVASYAQKWTQKFDNTNIISGSAFDLDYNDYTILFMGRPFEPEMFYTFIDKLESELTHPVRLYYWVDQQSGDYLNDRDGWTMLKREYTFVSHGLFMSRTPQRYSVWTYDPHEK